MFPARSPGTSTRISGVRPGVFSTINSALSGICFLVQDVANFNTRSMCPCFSQPGSKLGDLFGIFI